MWKPIVDCVEQNLSSKNVDRWGTQRKCTTHRQIYESKMSWWIRNPKRSFHINQIKMNWVWILNCFICFTLRIHIVLKHAHWLMTKLLTTFSIIDWLHDQLMFKFVAHHVPSTTDWLQLTYKSKMLITTWRVTWKC